MKWGTWYWWLGEIQSRQTDGNPMQQRAIIFLLWKFRWAITLLVVCEDVGTTLALKLDVGWKRLSIFFQGAIISRHKEKLRKGRMQVSWFLPCIIPTYILLKLCTLTSAIIITFFYYKNKNPKQPHPAGVELTREKGVRSDARHSFILLNIKIATTTWYNKMMKIAVVYETEHCSVLHH